MKIRTSFRVRHILVMGIASVFLLTACETKDDYDASGNFEADEVIVSAQQTGQLLSFGVQEGAELNVGDEVGQIDVKIPELQKQQAEASIAALKQKTGSSKEQTEVALKQLAVQESQLAQQIRERKRTENLVRADAATQKQLDDMDAGIDQLQKQIIVTRQQIKLYNYNAATQNRGILSEQSPLSVTAKQYQELIDRGRIINPLRGMVLTRYALKGEMTAIGKPLYKIANVDTLTLKAYITGDKLAQIKTGQKVTVRIDEGEEKYKTYPGLIYWISAKSEFTPKTIQTKNERANLVYALKIRVKNDGFLKIGMYGEVLF